MNVNDYTFLDRWFIPHPIDEVWPHIVTGEAYPLWWGTVYDAVEPLNDIPGDQEGAQADVRAHGRLPYRIHFVSEITEVEPPYRLGLKAEGDLTGTGLWQLREKGAGTAVTFEWRIRVDKPLLRLLSPLFKPILAWNHRWTMQQGERALIRLLSKQTKPA